MQSIASDPEELLVTSAGVSSAADAARSTSAPPGTLADAVRDSARRSNLSAGTSPEELIER